MPTKFKNSRRHSARSAREVRGQGRRAEARHAGFQDRQDHWASYDESYNLHDNSMWFYPDGIKPDHGIDTPRKQSGLRLMTQTEGFVLCGEAGAAGARFQLEDGTVATEDFAKTSGLPRRASRHRISTRKRSPVATRSTSSHRSRRRISIRRAPRRADRATSSATSPIPRHYKLVSRDLAPGGAGSRRAFRSAFRIFRRSAWSTR